MRRGTILIVGLLMASTAMPQAADARPLLLKMLERPHQLHWARFPAAAATPAGGRIIRAHGRPRPAPGAGAIAAAPAAAIAGTAAATGSAPSETATTAGSPPVKPRIRRTIRTPVRCRCRRRPHRSAMPRSTCPTTTPACAAMSLRACSPASARSGRWPGRPPIEDVIGFTLWPKEYGERLRVHGIGDVLGYRFAPSASIAARTRPNKVQQARADETTGASATDPDRGLLRQRRSHLGRLADRPDRQRDRAERRATRHARPARGRR